MFAPTPEGTPREPLSHLFDRLAGRFKEQSVSVAEVLATLGAEANAILIVFVCLPFCAPVTVPGTSTPAGLIAAFLAGQFALGRKPQLPARLLAFQLPPVFFRFAFRLASTLLRWLEKLLCPRLPWVLGSPLALRLHCGIIFMAGIFLALPLPPFPPLTNTLPALAVVITTLGLLERDGLAIVLGWVLLLVGIVYVTTMLLVGIEAFDWLLTWWRNRPPSP
jgi:hypothetical protein